jgi:hypothetical protein
MAEDAVAARVELEDRADGERLSQFRRLATGLSMPSVRSWPQWYAIGLG